MAVLVYSRESLLNIKPLKPMPGKTDSKGEATVKKVSPMPGDCFYSKVPTAFLQEETVNITVNQKECYHASNRRD